MTGAPACPEGFLANGVTAGLKPSGRPDLAVVLAPRGASAAAMLTTNTVRAAPLELTVRHLAQRSSGIRALLVNAGCANAATGPEGVRRASSVAHALATRLGAAEEQVLVNSTGVIGVQLPADRIVSALDALVDGATPDGLGRAAQAVMTTDTVAKVASADGAGFRVAGFAKGAGMIHPDLAPAVPHGTMIAAILTDADVEPARLQSILSRACARSFQRITVDGDTSTNDAVFALASGAAGRHELPAVEDAVVAVAHDLAMQVVRDGEGARKVLSVRVAGAASADDALAVARTVAMSLLVRTAVTGGDPNWGRILAAIGRSGARLDLGRLEVRADGVRLFADGAPVVVDPADRARIFKGPDVAIDVRLGLGVFDDAFHTCDLTKEYVAINAEYTT